MRNYQFQFWNQSNDEELFFPKKKKTTLRLNLYLTEHIYISTLNSLQHLIKIYILNFNT